MSNWGRPYFNNQNYYHRPNEPSEQSGSQWQYYPTSVNSNTPLVYPQQNGYNSSYHSGQRDFNSSGNRSGSNSAQFSNSGGGQVNNDIWAKAANSTLVATAGEFIPSASFHQMTTCSELEQDIINSGGARAESHRDTNNYNNNDTMSNENNTRKYQTSASSRFDKAASSQSDSAHYGSKSNHSNQNGYPDTRSHKSNYNTREFHQKNNGKSHWEKYNNRNNNYRQSGYGRSYGRGPGPGTGNTSVSGNGSGSGPSFEEMKLEGRRKLLQEVASLLTQPTADTSSSAVTVVDSSSNKGTSETSSKSNYHVDNSNVRPFVHYKRNFRSDKGNENYTSSSSSSSSFGSRIYNNSVQNNSDRKSYKIHSSHRDKMISQRERLTEQLERGTLECLVCYDRVKQTDSVWNCSNCYHVLHLLCIIEWANSSRSENGWRCPACQNVSKLTPKRYYCFCNKVVNPEWNRNDIPHSCGEVCNKSKPNPSPHFTCKHKCVLLCHPGPCPPCITMTERNCGCGRTTQWVQCGQNHATISCGEICHKELNCGEHFCQNVCHLGNCKECSEEISQECYCGENTRVVPCDKENIGIKHFECGNKCPKKLECGQHPCLNQCHPGPCGPCPLDANTVTHCPCGKKPLGSDTVRKSCLDPVPTCEEVCGKVLLCGPPGNRHACKSICHEGLCPTCELSTMVRCRCGHMDREVPCKELLENDDVRCQKKCIKKRSCGRHKCNQLCCIDIDHVCPIPCNRSLTCGLHRCEELCHNGRCNPCWRTSFEELYCECRSSVLFPPIPCGKKPPECNKPCARQHSCDHPALHNCHSDPNCPPCTVLTAKYCHGKHELRKTVPCHFEDFSCGLPCGKDLPCGFHKCNVMCHKGECLKPGQVCVQPCAKTRSLCGHACGAPCHEGECPDTPCKETVKVTCECGYRSMSRMCCENNKEYQRIATSLLASKMADVQLGRSIDLQDIQGARSKISLKTLECNDECRIVERNRRLSIGLQIRNPDLTAKLTPRYSDSMRAWAKKDTKFCQNVHDKLTELVQLAKQSKQKSRSYSFETMNREKRQFVHDYCEHFGCESVAYDAEPKRNVVATAQRDKAWLPSYSLLEVIQREMGQRKVPVPTLNGAKKPVMKSVTAPLVRLGQNHSSMSAAASSTSSNQPQVTNSPAKIDYFNYNG